MDAHNILKQKIKAKFVGPPEPGASGILEWDRDEQVIELTPASGAAETRTLLGPTRSGLKIRLDCSTFVASSTCTVTVNNSLGNSTGTIVFDAIREWANLESFWNAALTAHEWRVVASYCGTITTIPQVSTTSSSTSQTLTTPTITGQLGGNMAFKTGASVTAAGADQAGATALNEGDQVLVTGVTGQTGYGVKFPSASAAGKRTIVQNITAFACKLYPYGAEDIGAGASTAVTLAASTAVLVCFSAAGVGRVWTIGAQVTS